MALAGIAATMPLDQLVGLLADVDVTHTLPEIAGRVNAELSVCPLILMYLSEVQELKAAFPMLVTLGRVIEARELQS